jgi:hypothetical protein
MPRSEIPEIADYRDVEADCRDGLAHLRVALFTAESSQANTAANDRYLREYTRLGIALRRVE